MITPDSNKNAYTLVELEAVLDELEKLRDSVGGWTSTGAEIVDGGIKAIKELPFMVVWKWQKPSEVRAKAVPCRIPWPEKQGRCRE